MTADKFSKSQKIWEQGNSCFEIIKAFMAGDSGRQSPDACRVTT